MLTESQKTVLKTDILADPSLSALAHNQDSAFFIKNAYNALAVPDLFAWRTDAKTQDIFDQIDWSKFTPVDLPDAANAALHSARSMVIQTKQMNLQNILIGRDNIDASKANIRSALRDAVIQIPSGVGGANTSPGGASGTNVLNTCTRKATRAEKLFSSGSATTGTVTAILLSFEGDLTTEDVMAAMGW